MRLLCIVPSPFQLPAHSAPESYGHSLYMGHFGVCHKPECSLLSDAECFSHLPASLIKTTARC